jgi:hypothetical protein
MMMATCRGTELAGSGIDQRTMVWPRAGPTLTMLSLAPVNSASFRAYVLAAEGKSENFFAFSVEEFQPRNSS